MIRSTICNQRNAPIALNPNLSSRETKPPEYYKAIRQQKLALSSLSLAEAKREREKFLKAHASDKIRTHLAEANLQTKLHLAKNNN